MFHIVLSFSFMDKTQGMVNTRGKPMARIKRATMKRDILEYIYIYVSVYLDRQHVYIHVKVDGTLLINYN